MGVLDASEPTVDEREVEREVEARARVERVGDIEVEPRPGGYGVTIRLNVAPPDTEWSKLFEHPPDLPLQPPARRASISGASIEIFVHNEEQMSASVKHAERALAEANRVYNDEVLPRRERHRRLREVAQGREQVGLDAMSRAASTL